MATKKKDGEGPMIILGALFTAVLLALDLTYSNLGGMFSGPDGWVGALWVLLHAVIVVTWFVVVKYWEDPNKDFFRWVLFITIFAAIATTGLHRAGWLDEKQVIIDSRKNAAQP